MRRRIVTVADLKQYLQGMFRGRPGDHYPRIKHAPHVAQTIFEIAGNLVMTADDNSIEVSQRTNGAGIARDVNMIWFTVQGRPRAMIYASDAGVEIRDGGRGGAVLARIDNTNRSGIAAIFAGL
jgi:hypothetical protein